MKFLRLFRSQSTNTKDYIKYAVGEVFLVVIGILIALSVNNANEERKLRKTLGWIKQCNTIRGVNIQDLDEDVELYMEYLEHGI